MISFAKIITEISDNFNLKVIKTDKDELLIGGPWGPVGGIAPAADCRPVV